MKKIIILILVLIFCFNFVKAQESFLLPKTGVYDLEVLEKKQNKLKLKFLITNAENLQSDIRYGINLFRISPDNDSKELVDEKVYPEKLDLKSGDRIEKEIEYILPGYLEGKFELQLIARNKNGFLMGIASLSNVNLEKRDDYLEVVEDSCFLTVEGDNHPDFYDIDKGADFGLEEKVFLHCRIKNNFSSNLQINPIFETFFRTTFGEKVESQELNNPLLLIKPGEEKEIKLNFPKALQPQTYDTRVYFYDEKNRLIPSNSLIIHYSIKGNSAVINNLSIDKNFYKKGENINISLIYTESKRDSLSSNSSLDKNLSFKIEVFDNKNKSCGEILNKEVSSDENYLNLNYQTTKDCQNPSVKVSVRDNNSKITLYSDNFDFNFKKENQGLTLKIIFLVSFLIIIFTVMFVIWKKRKSNLLFLFFAIFTFGLFFGTAQAEQRSINYSTRPGIGPESWSDHNLNLIYSLDKQTYKPGDVMVVDIKIEGGNDISKYFDLEAKYIESGQIRSRRGADQATLRFMIPEDVEDGRQNLEVRWKDYRYQSISDGGHGPWMEEVYLNTKAQHANQMGYTGSYEPNVGRTSWTGDTIKQELSAMGYTARSHFDEFNEAEKAEGVTPYMTLSDFKGQASVIIGTSFIIDSTSSTDQQNDSYVPGDSGTGGSGGVVDEKPIVDDSNKNIPMDEGSSSVAINYSTRPGIGPESWSDHNLRFFYSLDKSNKTYRPGDTLIANIKIEDIGSHNFVDYSDLEAKYIESGQIRSRRGANEVALTFRIPDDVENGQQTLELRWKDYRYQSISDGGHGPWMEEVYLNTKAQHANQMGYTGSYEPNVGRTSWTGDTIKQELSAMGYTARSHFDEFNEAEKAEGVTPYMTLSDFKGDTPGVSIKVNFTVDSNASDSEVGSGSGGVDSNNYSCTGAILGNSEICQGDDRNLTSNEERMLVDVCTSQNKCEYVCKADYIIKNSSCVYYKEAETGGIEEGLGEQRSINYSTRPGIGPEGWSDHNLNLIYSLDKQTYKPGDVMVIDVEVDGGNDISKYFDLEAKYIESGQIRSRRGADQATLRFMIPEDVEDGRQNLEIKWKDYRYQSIADGGHGPWLEEVYLNTKAQHANQMGYTGSHEPNIGRTSWTGETIKQELAAMGYTPRSHFDEFNEAEKAEGVTPYMTLSDFKGQTSVIIGVSLVIDSTSSSDQQNDSYVPDNSGTGGSEVADDSSGDDNTPINNSNSESDKNSQGTLNYKINGQDQSINWTVGLDKEVYAPEEVITASMNMSNVGSGDAVSYGDYYILITGNNWWERKSGGGQSSKISYFKAPTEPGTYEAKFQWQDERYIQAINNQGDYQESDFSAVPSIVKVINFEVREGGSVIDDTTDNDPVNDGETSDEKNQKPTATINSPQNNTTVSYGELINFSGSGNDPDGGSIMAYEWRDGSCDGYILDSNPSYKVSYWQSGTHNIYLKVQDNKGAWSTNCPSVTINVIEDEEDSKIDNGEPPVPYLEYVEENQYRKSEGETMSLKEGWNLVTFPNGEYSGAKINNNSATDLSEVRGELEIWEVDEQCSSSEGRSCFSVMPKREGYQELGSLEKNRNYWVYSDSSRSISFCNRTDQKCLIPISGSADNQPTERFSRGFNLINSTLLNYVLNYRSRFNFYVLDWDSDRSKWLVTNQDNQEVGGFERLRNILESKSYFMYIRESEDVDELNSLISR